MMNLLLTDTETTGLHTDEKARLIEVAVALYSVDAGSIIWCHSHLDWHHENPAYESNKINLDLLNAADVIHRPREEAENYHVQGWEQIARAVFHAKCFVAFDRDGSFDKHFVTQARPDIGGYLPWINSRDFKYNRTEGGGSLDYIACKHEIVPFGPWRHRALWDVLLMAALLGRVPNLGRQVERLLLPKIMFEALVSYDDRDLAKQAGYRWHGSSKTWWRWCPSDEPLDATEDRQFRIKQVSDGLTKRIVEDERREEEKKREREKQKEKRNEGPLDRPTDEAGQAHLPLVEGPVDEGGSGTGG